VSNSILLVEDEPVLILTLEELLLDEGCRVQIAQNGTDAINALEAGESFDVLVTDIRLPHVNGWEIARRARELLPDLPVIYMSGDSTADHGANGVSCSVMLSKPFALDNFLQVVTAAMPGAR